MRLPAIIALLLVATAVSAQSLSGSIRRDFFLKQFPEQIPYAYARIT
jgi:hypothetical protein